MSPPLGRALRLAAEQFDHEAAQARKQMLSTVDHEQRAYWTGVYTTYYNVAQALRLAAVEYEEGTDVDAT